MKKITLFFAFVIIINTAVMSQPGLPEGIVFTEQIEIDNFQTNHPNITEIEGDVIIHGEDIANLDGLSVLTSLQGGISIYGTFLLTDLSGLENVNFISGHLNLWNNEGMTDLTGLENVTSIEGDMEVISNGILDNLMGLNNLTHVDGLIRIHYNDNINSMNGLNNLAYVGGYLSFVENALLWDLSALNKLDSIGNGLAFYDNNLLVNIEGLSNLAYLAGDLRFEHNDILIDITGLENIVSSEISHLIIADNALLSECEITTVCDYLEVPSNTTYIADNAVGCNNRNEIVEACLVGIQTMKSDLSISIYPNPATKELSFLNMHNLIVKEVIIYNQIGKKILQVEGLPNTINISSLSTGFYYVKIHTPDQKIIKKLIVK